MDQSTLIKQTKSKNKVSNLMLLLKAIMDLVPQVMVVHIISLMFIDSLTVSIIITDGLVILTAYLLKSAFDYIAIRKAHDAAYSSLTDLRLQLISHLKKLPLGFFQTRSTGDLTNIIQHDVEQVEVYLAHGLPEIMSATLIPIITFVAMLFIDWRLALLLIIGLPLMWLTQKLSSPLWKKNTKIFYDSVNKMQSDLVEYVATIDVIKAFGKEETKTEKTIQSTKDYIYWVKKAMMGISIPMGLITLFMESGVVLVILFGTYFLSKGDISVSKFILSMLLGVAFTASITKIATFHHYGIVFNQAMENIGSILKEPIIKQTKNNNTLKEGDIHIRSLDFAYNGKEKTLNNINLVFKKGSKNALVGASGCGKTTLANLIMGFWIPDQGNISISNVDTMDMSEKQLNAFTSIVQQEVFLFNMSIEENIKIGKPTATLNEIIEAAKKARIHEFIMSLPNGYNTTVGESGMKFSGGEKQRISIARMILKDAPIIILDEATAAVDSENEVYIQEAIDDLSKDKTVIMIAHHLNTIKDCDQIVVMDKGKVLDSGTHNDLLDRCKLYQDMVYNQNKVDNWIIKEMQNG